jgi:hypothetical protein
VRAGLGAAVILLTFAMATPIARATPTVPATPTKATPTGPATARQTPSEAENYVRWVYLNLLRRPADPGGLAYWTGVVQANGPGLFVYNVVTGDEWRTAWVNIVYESLWLDRSADEAGLAFWKSYLAADNRFDDFEVAVGASDEAYELGGGTDADFVGYVYQIAAARLPTPDELAEGLEALATGSTTQFLGSVLRSTDGLATRVRLAYRATLYREPDAGGLAYWSGFYHQTGSMSQMLAAQIMSAEAWELAQDPPDGMTDLRSLVKR